MSQAVSVADAVELATYLAELANAGLPIDSSLRAMAEEMPGGRLPALANQLASKLEAGQTLANSVEELGPQLPVQVRALVVSGARTGRLGASLDALLEHEQSIDDLTRSFWRALAYPAVLMGLLTVWLVCVSIWFVKEMPYKILEDFGTEGADRYGVAANLQLFSQWFPMVLGVIVGTLALMVALAAISGGRGRISRLFSSVPVCGEAWWYRGLTEFCGLLEVYLRQQLPLIEALRLTASAARDPAIRTAALYAATASEQGRALSQTMADDPYFPPTLVQVLAWGEQRGALVESLSMARGMFRDRCVTQLRWLQVLLPPVAFMIVAASAIFVMAGIMGGMLTMIRLINDLTG